MNEPAAAPTLAVLSKTTRIELAHQRHGSAVDRVQTLGMQLKSAFEELHDAGEDLHQHGIEITVTLDFPLREAWFDWRAKTQVRQMDGAR
jgi:hypothetical protein